MKENKGLGLAIIRIITGVVFFAHGYQKLIVWGIGGVTGGFTQIGIPAPHLSAYLATFAEFFGGIALLLGLGTRLAAIPVAFTMVVAILQVHLKGGFFAPQGFEYPLTLLAANIAMIVAGGGAFALDNVLFRSKNKESETALRPRSVAA
ncbi:MAG TPA: DoxX family protein [Terriglobales bacterium]